MAPLKYHYTHRKIFSSQLLCYYSPTAQVSASLLHLAISLPFIVKNSKVLSNIAESELSLFIIGNTFFISSPKTLEEIVSSLEYNLFTLPLKVFISPL